MPVTKKKHKRAKLLGCAGVESRGVCTSPSNPPGSPSPCTSEANPAPLRRPAEQDIPDKGSKEATPKTTSPVSDTARPAHHQTQQLILRKSDPRRSSRRKDSSRRRSLHREEIKSVERTVRDRPRSVHQDSYSKNQKKQNSAKFSPFKDDTTKAGHEGSTHNSAEARKGNPSRPEGCCCGDPMKAHSPRGPTSPLRDAVAGHKKGGQRRPHSYQEVDAASPRAGLHARASELVEASQASVRQELLQLSLARQALEAEKAELRRGLEQREVLISELRRQMSHRDNTIQLQRLHLHDALKNGQSVKGVGGGEGRSTGAREELQLVRDAIISLRSNFRETDPNQHTLDTLEQAIAILIERGSGGGCTSGQSGDKAGRPTSDRRPHTNGVAGDNSTKVIYFTERTVTPFMSTIAKRLGDITLRDFKNMFDRPGVYRFHFKSYDPEYGLVKEEIGSDDDVLPGVDGKIIAWVEEDGE